MDAYIADSYSGFLVSNQLIYSVVNTMMQTARIKNIEKMNPQLPILLVSGKDDPFGDFGNAIRNLGKLLKKVVLNISLFNYIKTNAMKCCLKMIKRRYGSIC